MRVLLIAPTCDGEDIGEAWVAHQWASQLAERHEVTLLTYHKRGRTPASRQLHGLRVIEWTEPPLLGRAERLNSLLKPGYVPFYVRARRWIKAALARGEDFDVVHQPVPVAMRYPCPAIGLGIPVVIGPVGGGMKSPLEFQLDEGTAPKYVALRDLDAWRLRRDPLLRRTYENADCVLGIAPYVAAQLHALTLRRFEVMSETGLVELPAATSRPPHEGPLRLLFVGRIIRTKGARDIIRALALEPQLDVTLDIVGAGPDRAACEELVTEGGLGAMVTFHGALPKSEVMDFYRSADVFVFPSYREPGGNVVFEAMGAGLPLIVCDRGGPGAAVDETCAIALAVESPDQLATDILSAVKLLAGNPARRSAMGEAARRRLSEVGLWSTKVDQMDIIYRSLC